MNILLRKRKVTNLLFFLPLLFLSTYAKVSGTHNAYARHFYNPAQRANSGCHHHEQ